MKLGAPRLRALAKRLRPLSQATAWRERLAERQRINAKLEALWAAAQANPGLVVVRELSPEGRRQLDEMCRRMPDIARELERLFGGPSASNAYQVGRRLVQLSRPRS